jgi:Secretion system C-terminal sorting domain
MKKNFTIIALLSFFTTLTAQDNRRNFVMKFAFSAADTLRKALPVNSIANTSAFIYNSVTNEFWASSSHNDSIIRFSVPNGSYLGALRTDRLTNGNTTRFFRAFTQKDNYIWGVNNTDTIRKLDPITGQEVQRFPFPKWMSTQNQVAYDSVSKGFWVAGSAYRYRLMDTTFTTVKDSFYLGDTEVALNGVGQVALLFDAATPGGPYFWFYGGRSIEYPLNVGAGGSPYFTGYPATLSQVSAGTKKRTGVQKMIADDFDLIQNINQAPRAAALVRLPGVTNPVLIMHVAKFTSGTSVLPATDLSGVTVGYEIVTPWYPEAGIDSMKIAPNYAMVPTPFARPLTVSAKVRNVILNQNAVGNVRFDTRSEAGSLLNTQSVPFSLGGMTAAFYNGSNTVSNLKPGRNQIKANLLHPNDFVLRNDTMSSYVTLTDSTLARDYVEYLPFTRNNRTCFCATSTQVFVEKPEIGTSYKLDVPSTVNSITIRFSPYRSGDTTRFRIYTIDAQGKPVFKGQSALYQISSADSASTYLTLPLLTPVQIPANQTFMVSMTEGIQPPVVFWSKLGYEKSAVYVYSAITLKGWVVADTSSLYLSPGLKDAALAIRPNFLLRTAVEESIGVNQWTVAPNPTEGVVNLNIDLTTEAAVQLRIYNLNGQMIHQTTYDKAKHFEPTLDMSGFANGMYILSLTTPQGTVNRKVVKE